MLNVREPLREFSTDLLTTSVMTIIGITASQQTTLEEKMAGNLRDQTLALQAGEAVLRWTETWVGDQVGEPIPVAACGSGCDDTVWVLNTLALTSAAVWSTASVRSNYTGLPTTGPGKVAAAPRSVVEQYHEPVRDTLNRGMERDGRGPLWFYRLTANGTGGSTSAQALLQSTYSRRY